MSEIDNLQWWTDAASIATIVTAAIGLLFLILGFVWKEYAKAEKIAAILAAFLTVVFAIFGFIWNKNLNKMKDAEAARIQKESEQKIKELQTQTAPRTLSAEQQTKLIEFLKNSPIGTVEVHVISGMTEATDFANQLLKVLKQAGWTAELSFTMGEFSVDTKGLVLEVPNPKDPAANALIQGMQTVGLKPVGNNNPNLQTMILFVGAKP
jgi:hypothetical protein